MKRRLIIWGVVIAMLPAMAQNAPSSYFTIGKNDTLEIAHVNADGMLTVDVRAHFGEHERWDGWSLDMTYPPGLVPVSVSPGPDLAVTYTGQDGMEHEYEPSIAASEGFTALSCTMGMVQGYWDQYGNGSYTRYGSVKWEPGDYGSMFTMTFLINEGFTGGTLVIDGTLRAGYDYRYWSSGGSVMFYKRVTVILQPLLGDVDGDGKLSIADVTGLTDLLIYGDTSSSEDVMQAADVNRDAIIGIADVTALIDLLLSIAD